MADLFQRQGSEFLVNTGTLNNQELPTITSLASGGFVVSWMDVSGASEDGGSTSIKAQLLDASGVKIGGELQVSSAVANGQQEPTVSSLASGGFIVSWMEFGGTGDPSGWGIKAQIFDAAGEKVGSDFLVNSATASTQMQPSVTALGDGFVVTWADSSKQGGDEASFGIKAQLFDASGDKLGAEFLVNETTAGRQEQPVITALQDGFVVTWIDGPADGGTGYKIKAQLFDDDGAKVGNEFLVNADRPADQLQPVVTPVGDGFVIAWEDHGGTGADDSRSGIKGQLFDASGAKSGSEFLINTQTLGFQQQPTIAALGDGFVVSWTDPGSEGEDRFFGIKAQVFDASGEKVGTEFLVNEVTVDVQSEPAVATLGDGFVVTWRDFSGEGGDGSGAGIKAQIFVPITAGPTDIAISDNKVSEAAVENLEVATLSATGAVNSSFSFSIVSDSTGGAFGIDGERLVVRDNDKLDHETAPMARVTVRATDSCGNSYRETLELAVTDSNEGQLFAAGAEFQVNTETEGQQLQPALATLGNGFVAAWSDWSGKGADPDDYGIRAQLFDDAGRKVGGEFVVNTETIADQQQPDVAALSGGFVVIWADGSGQGADPAPYGIKAQLFDASGAKVGDEFLVNASVNDSQVDPTVTAVGDGFVVSWTDQSQDTGEGGQSEIRAQLFDASGAKVGNEFMVNTAAAQEQVQPTVAALGDGFIVSWADLSGEGGDAFYGIKAQRFDASGEKVGSEFLVNTETLSDQQQPAIAALSSGGFVVSWMDGSGEGPDDSGYGIKAQLFDASGEKVGGEFLVNGETAGHQLFPAVAAFGDGFVVSWTESSDAGGIFRSVVKAQVFDAAGHKIGGEFLVASSADRWQEQPAVTTIEDAFVVSWIDLVDDGGPGSDSTVKARIFRDTGAASREADTINLGDGGEERRGEAGDDRITGGAGDDRLIGDTGDDVLQGRSGDDRLQGVHGADEMHGGAGNDTFCVRETGDRAIELADDGYDRVVSSIDFILGANIEELRLLRDALDGTGNKLANRMSGSDGANMLFGLGGDDQLFGGNGEDDLRGGLGGDRLSGGREGDRLAGGAADDTLVGGLGADRLAGGDGADDLAGGRGRDLLLGGGGGDRFEFRTAGPGTADRIMDFSRADDTILLAGPAFEAIGSAGEIGEDAFHVGTAAADAEDRIVYDQATGRLFFDADGTGEIAAILFVRVDPQTALSAADFEFHG